MATITTSINVSAQKATVAALLSALVKGINTQLVGLDPFEFDGTSIPRADLLARLQAILDLLAAVKSARTALAQAVAKQRAAVAQGRVLRAGLKRLLQTKYGPQSPKLQEFGFTPARTPKTPVKAKAAAKVQAAATRLARGTKGKKQKALIKAAPAQAAASGPPSASPTPTTPTPKQP